MMSGSDVKNKSMICSEGSIDQIQFYRDWKIIINTPFISLLTVEKVC